MTILLLKYYNIQFTNILFYQLECVKAFTSAKNVILFEEIFCDPKDSGEVSYYKQNFSHLNFMF